MVVVGSTLNHINELPSICCCNGCYHDRFKPLNIAYRLYANSNEWAIQLNGFPMRTHQNQEQGIIAFRLY